MEVDPLNLFLKLQDQHAEALTWDEKQFLLREAFRTRPEVERNVLDRIAFFLGNIKKDGVSDDAYLAVSVYEKGHATRHLPMAPTVGDLIKLYSALESLEPQNEERKA